MKLLPSLFVISALIIDLVSGGVEREKRQFFSDAIQSISGLGGNTDVCRDEISAQTTNETRTPNNDKMDDGIIQLTAHAGHRATLYEVITKDGYKLSLFRVFRIKEPTQEDNKTPVLLVHGMMLCAKMWLANSKNKALAYRLIKEGKDVWIGANRGTAESKNHTTLDITLDRNYWDFSNVEIAKYDDPAFVDKIEEVTGKKQIYYIGHGSGSKNFFTWMSLGPKNCSRIKAMIALGPLAYMKNARSPLFRSMSAGSRISGAGLGLLGHHEWNVDDPYGKSAKNAFCSTTLSCSFCRNMINTVMGFNAKQENKGWGSFITSNLPCTTSYKYFIHFAQETFLNRFGYFDYGPVPNAKEYGFGYMRVPPQMYPVQIGEEESCKDKINLIYSENDWMADPRDVKRLADELGPALKSMQKVADPDFNHLDFLFGKDVDKFVVEPILEIMKGYDGESAPAPAPA